jgi:hypothetical protein
MPEAKPKHVMKLYPWDEVMANVVQKIEEGAECYQQWNCEHCRTKQTMERPNKFFETGQCEECKKVTDIRKNGMNFMMHIRV